MFDPKSKAEDIYFSGWGIVEEEHAPAVMKELESHNETFYDSEPQGGYVMIKKALLELECY